MGLNYNAHTEYVLIGSKDGTTRTSVDLTDAYGVANKTASFKTAGYSKLNLDLLYTMGATETSNSIEVRVEGSPDGTNWYRIPNEVVSAGTSTLTAREFTFVGSDAAAATVSIGLDIFYNYMRVSVKESGVASNAGTIYAEATLNGM